MPAPSAPDWCTKVGPECPVEGTIYGYYPSLGGNAFFAAFFGLALLVQLFQGIKWKTWTFMIGLGFGTFAECVGYIGRIIMNNNPYSQAGFNMQIVCLIIAPAFITAGIYLTLKHLVLSFGEEHSWIKGVWYTRIFIACDILSLVLQGAGGGTAATANPGSSMLNTGSNLMLAGIVFQVVVLVVYGTCLTEYLLRVYRNRASLAPSAIELAHKQPFRLFMGAVFVAYIMILTRCIYRIPEMSGGWRNPIMQNQAEFIVLDGVMIVIATLALTIFHPGYCFPALASTFGKKNNKLNEEKRSGESSDGVMV
ncbi:sphingoid long-chain base transporter RSB1 [Mytilinidion resinicola]|uniref:Sphingoid long-chain base transporter RSB1 n=1 Tax=Mytilinidion resinicola TaxID=574789 RepID=A0A6A6Y1P0_9PEZI|nr:sphingoid long-chain base transporter RSB1 [Mytilinidion resinicola]KAF2802692.1 sphingoid long-chain base transporter RSB1 [Mytilinidion resinicola]